jgi:hypothetical protein
MRKVELLIFMTYKLGGLLETPAVPAAFVAVISPSRAISPGAAANGVAVREWWNCDQFNSIHVK